MAGKILIVGAGANDALLLAKLKEKHGNDIVLVTPEEAKEQGLKMEDFANIPTYKITAPPIMMEIGEYKTGKEQRRERRKKERMSNKHR